MRHCDCGFIRGYAIANKNYCITGIIVANIVIHIFFYHGLYNISFSTNLGNFFFDTKNNQISSTTWYRGLRTSYLYHHIWFYQKKITICPAKFCNGVIVLVV